ncbi:MAG: TRAP transporter large permease [Chloroflexota bacterium]
MSPPLVGAIGFVVMLLLILLGLPIGFSMMLIAVVGTAYFTNLHASFSLVGIIPYTTSFSYLFAVVPLFTFMGMISYEIGITTGAYRALYKWLGALPGGLAMATIGACAAFAATCGSSLAGAASMSKVAAPEMFQYKYDPKLVTGSIAAGGTLGILIPPSIGFIVYGMITETSIGQLFIAGFFPGLLLSGLFMLGIYVMVKRNPKMGPPGPGTNWRERLIAIKDFWQIAFLFLLVIGGIYAGVFTPTEAAAVGAFVAVVLGLVQKKLTGEKLMRSFRETVHTTGMLFVVVIAAMLFNYFIGLSRIPLVLADIIGALGLSRYLILTFILVALIFLGCIMDAMAMILLTMPILFPVVIGLGFDPVWFGVITVIMMEAGLITPPIGLNVYIVSGAIPEVPLEDVFRGIPIFLLLMIVCVIILTFFPQIALFLPNLTMS